MAKFYDDDDDEQEKVKTLLIENIHRWRMFPLITPDKVTIDSLENKSVYIYQLDSFIEKREAFPKYRAYSGGSIDSCKWREPCLKINVEPPKYFEKSERRVFVPQSEKLEDCWDCMGTKERLCRFCLNGSQTCIGCSGTYCFRCKGLGLKQCRDCKGSAKEKCITCLTTGKLVWFTELKVSWSNVRDYGLFNETKIPDELVLKAGGEIIFKEQRQRVQCPMIQTELSTICYMSQKLIRRHQNSYFSKHIKEQRQIVKRIPVIEVRCKVQRKQIRYFVFGSENVTYFDKTNSQSHCITL